MRSSKDQVTDVLLEGPSPSRNGWAAGFGLYTVYSGRCHSSETGPPALLPAPAVKAPQRNGIGPGPPALSYWERPEGAHSAERRGRGSPARRGDEPRPPAGRFFSSAQEMVGGKGLASHLPAVCPVCRRNLQIPVEGIYCPVCRRKSAKGTERVRNAAAAAARSASGSCRGANLRVLKPRRVAPSLLRPFSCAALSQAAQASPGAAHRRDRVRRCAPFRTNRNGVLPGQRSSPFLRSKTAYSRLATWARAGSGQDAGRIAFLRRV